MKKELMYVYLGTNGTITSPIHLEDIYYTNRYAITADLGKKLTNDGINFYKYRLIPAEEIEDWYEIDE